MSYPAFCGRPRKAKNEMMAWSGLPQNVRLSEWLGVTAWPMLGYPFLDVGGMDAECQEGEHAR